MRPIAPTAAQRARRNGGRRRCRVCPAHVVAGPGHAHDCRGEIPSIRMPFVVLGMTRKTLVCKRGLFSSFSLNGNLPIQDFHRHAEAMHARWADIRARPSRVSCRAHSYAAATPLCRTRMRRFNDARFWPSTALRSPGEARAAQTRSRQTSALLDR